MQVDAECQQVADSEFSMSEVSRRQQVEFWQMWEEDMVKQKQAGISTMNNVAWANPNFLLSSSCV